MKASDDNHITAEEARTDTADAIVSAGPASAVGQNTLFSQDANARKANRKEVKRRFKALDKRFSLCGAPKFINFGVANLNALSVALDLFSDDCKDLTKNPFIYFALILPLFTSLIQLAKNYNKVRTHHSILNESCSRKKAALETCLYSFTVLYNIIWVMTAFVYMVLPDKENNPYCRSTKMLAILIPAFQDTLSEFSERPFTRMLNRT
jgi:hypothetical protein